MPIEFILFACVLAGVALFHRYALRIALGGAGVIVAASNASGAGSVIGDTTTTRMRIAGISPLAVLEAYIAATVALVRLDGHPVDGALQEAGLVAAPRCLAGFDLCWCRWCCLRR